MSAAARAPPKQSRDTIGIPKGVGGPWQWLATHATREDECSLVRRWPTRPLSAASNEVRVLKHVRTTDHAEVGSVGQYIVAPGGAHTDKSHVRSSEKRQQVVSLVRLKGEPTTSTGAAPWHSLTTVLVVKLCRLLMCSN